MHICNFLVWDIFVTCTDISSFKNVGFAITNYSVKQFYKFLTVQMSKEFLLGVSVYERWPSKKKLFAKKGMWQIGEGNLKVLLCV